MTNPITGIIHVTGEPDTGKTSFALSSGAMPEETVFFDDDVKGRETKRHIEQAGHTFGKYLNLIELRKGKTDIAFHEAVIAELKGLARDKYRVLVWDTWSNFERTIQPYAAKHEREWRVSYSQMGAIHGAEQWTVADQEYEPQLLNMLLDIAPLVILCAHVKQGSVEGKKIPGRMVSEVRPAVVRKSVMRVWLRHNPLSQAPTGLIVKRLPHSEVTPQGIRPVAVFPRRIGTFTWETVLDYWANPVRDRPLRADEIPNAFELSILDGTLTADQKDMLKLLIAAGGQSDGGEFALLDKPTLTADQKDKARELKAEGKRAPAIARELSIDVSALLEAMPDLV